ncbi:CCA tRNA nucleotidyltransferase [Candidatus Magnetomonas plexicatena]|uniref:CCA tRNA nucleotidyltransferase n=1 Tax=Candidatus Magnetomonas plexicatena TaxID=2552947 RepID=UPI0011016C38|nr:CCA tRNA nucleotidyltransferase [Nitrospirales bacterium LBB_01]
MSHDLNPLYMILKEEFSSRSDVWVVGGTVRDILMGLEQRDIDIAIPGENPYAEAGKFADKIKGTFVKLNDKFKTVRVVKGSYYFDFTSFRGNTIEDDLLQRDFTINAMAFPLHKGVETLVDVTGGFDDLKAGLIKMVSVKNLKDDPLRMLRAFRFMAELGFNIDATTVDAITSLKELIANVPAERVLFELKEMTRAQKPSSAVSQMNQCGLLAEVFFEMKTFDIERAAALYHEVEKIITSVSDSPFMTHLNSYIVGTSHRLPFLKLSALLCAANISADAASNICVRLKTSADEANFVHKILKHHGIALSVFKSDMKTDMVVRFLLDVGDDFFASLVLTLAELTLNSDDTSGFITFCDDITTFYMETYLPRLTTGHFITGHDLIKTFGLKPSPLFSRILGQVQAMTLEGSISKRSEALTVVENILLRTNSENVSV